MDSNSSNGNRRGSKVLHRKVAWNRIPCKAPRDFFIRIRKSIEVDRKLATHAKEILQQLNREVRWQPKPNPELEAFTKRLEHSLIPLGFKVLKPEYDPRLSRYCFRFTHRTPTIVTEHYRPIVHRIAFDSYVDPPYIHRETTPAHDFACEYSIDRYEWLDAHERIASKGDSRYLEHLRLTIIRYVTDSFTASK